MPSSLREGKGGSSATARPDVDHNEFLNTADLLAENLLRNLGGGNLATTAQSESSEPDTSGTLFMTPSKARRLMRNSRVAANSAKNGKATDGPSKLDDFDKKAAGILDKMKEDLVELYQRAKSDADKDLVHKVIGGIESVQEIYGYPSRQFNPDRYLSGLSLGDADILTNASSVVDATVRMYKANAINAISSVIVDDKPAVRAVIIGQRTPTVGFVANVKVVAKTDFNGNEALDFVPDGKGIFTVKAFRSGRWVDVSDRFDVDGVMKEYKIESGDGDHPHSVFIGEKIASTGKEILLSSLNLNDGDVKFGNHTAFCRKAADADGIKKCIRIST